MTQRYVYFTAGLSPSPPSLCHLLSPSLRNGSTGLAKKFVEVFCNILWEVMVFPVVMYRCERWIIKKADAFELWCWRRLFVVVVKFLLIYSCTGSSLLHTGFLYLRRVGAILCSTQVSHWGGFSCCRAWALDTQTSVAVVLRHVGSSQTRDQTYVPCIGRQILKPLDHQGGPRKDSWESLGQQADQTSQS